MKTITQTWEMRNLGLKCLEIKISHEDKVDNTEIEEIVLDNEFDYIQATVPAGKMDIAYYLQQNGFLFTETRFSLISNLETLKLPRIFSRIYDRIDYHEANTNELDKIYTCLKNGVFDSDRYSLDPKIGRDKSGNRYYEWCKSEVESGESKAYAVNYKGEPLGFFILKLGFTKYSYGLMGGLYNKLKDAGRGIGVLYPPMELSKRYKYEYITTGISSNNPSSLRMHLALGYEIQELEYIFVRHNQTHNNMEIV